MENFLQNIKRTIFPFIQILNKLTFQKQYMKLVHYKINPFFPIFKEN
jgi:hypothetical protein